MNRKILVSVVVAFAMSLALGLLGRALLLHADGMALAKLFASVVQQLPYANVLLPAHLLIAVGFVWIYLEQRQDGPFLAQGLRFGLAVAAFMAIPVFLAHHTVHPEAASLVATQVACQGVGVTVMGVVVAWLNA